MRDADEARREGTESWPSVTIFSDGSYRIESGGRVGVGPDPETAWQDLNHKHPATDLAPVGP